MGYTSLRDVFCPEKSTLAQSIRSQMPYPEEAPSAREMFAIVDKDIQENGKWFDKVAVGKEWVLGEQASYIPRIRAVFPRDEIVHRHAGGRVQTSRIVELWIMDDRHQVQSTTLKDYRELQPLVDCIQLRAPDALILPYSEFDRYNFMEDEEWQKVLQDFRLRDGRRKASQPRMESQPAQNMVLTRADGTVTSRLSMDILSQTLEECLQAPEETFFLTPSRPIQGEKGAYMELLCSAGTALEGKGNCRIATGSYAGTGEYGKAHPNTIQLPFPAQMILLDVSASKHYNGIPEYYILFRQAPSFIPDETLNGSNMLTWNDSSVSWYYTDSHPDGALYQFNKTGQTYHYTVIG